MNPSSTRTTITALAGLAGILLTATSVQAAITVANDYTFNDNTLPTGFTAVGSPSFSGGQLVLDGASSINANTEDVFGGTAPATNYAFEVVFTATTFNSFDIMSSIAADSGGNSGLFIYSQSGTYRGIEANEGAFNSGVATALNTETTISYVVEDIDGLTATASLFVNGVLEATRTLDSSGATPIDTLNTTIVIGSNLFDHPAGAFNGTINRARYFTFDAGDDASLFQGDASNDNLLVIPEPSSFAFLGLALSSLLLRRRRA